MYHFLYVSSSELISVNIFTGGPAILHLPSYSTMGAACPQRHAVWTPIPNVKGASLPIDEAGKMQPFVIRFQLLDCLFDIPSTCLTLDQESLQLVSLSLIPSEDTEIAATRASAKLRARVVRRASLRLSPLKISRYSQPLSIDRSTESPHQDGSVQSDLKDSSLLQGGSAQHHEDSILSNDENKSWKLSPREASLLSILPRRVKSSRRLSKQIQDDTRGTWIPSRLPQRRQKVNILVRTSQRVTQGDRTCFDIFLTSSIVVRNNTNLGIQIFPTVPGPFTYEPITSFLGMYHCVPPIPDLSIPVEARAMGKTVRPKRKGSVTTTIIPTHRFNREEIERQQRPETVPDPSIPGLHITSPSGIPHVNFLPPVSEEETKTPRQKSVCSDDITYGSTLLYQSLQMRTDILKFEALDPGVIPIPLHWLVCSNAAIWATGIEEKLFIRGDLRELVSDHEKSDLFLQVSLIRIYTKFSRLNQ